MQSDLFLQRPWRTRQDAVADAPFGFLQMGESHLLYHLARDYCTGAGVIVDGGSFLGRSAYCFARGLEDRPAGGPPIRIHCFDNFLVNDTYTAHSIRERLGVELALGASTRFLFDRAVARVGSWIEVYEGDLLRIQWAPRPIEVLFVDVAKSKALGSRVLELFFPSLIPGRSIVVHQDYHHPWLPHIHVVMEYLAEYFEFVEPRIDESAAFLLKAPIPRERLAHAIAYPFSYPEQRALMDRALQRLPEDCRAVVALARACLVGTNDRPAEMRRVVEEALASAGAASQDPIWCRYRDQVVNMLEEREGWAALEAGDARRGLALADSYLSRNSLESSPHVLRFQCCLRLGDLDTAERSLNKAFEIDSGLRFGRLHKAHLHLAKGKLADAEREAIDGLREAPEDPWAAAEYLAICTRSWVEGGRLREARAILEDLGRSAPTNPWLPIARATIDRQSGDMPGAVARLRGVPASSPARELAQRLLTSWQQN